MNYTNRQGLGNSDKLYIDTIGTSSGLDLKFYLLVKREEVLEQLRIYEYRVGRGLEPPIHKLRSCIVWLYEAVQSSYKSSRDKEALKKVIKYTHSYKYTELHTAWQLLDDFLYEKNITKFDTKKKYDTADMEAENDAKNI
jgi:hypothetical protein